MELDRKLRAQYYTVNDLVELLGCSRQTIYNWRFRHRMPAARGKIGGQLVWDRAVIDEWVRARGLQSH